MGTKVLVTTGAPWNNGRMTEVIDLENPSFECSKIGQFPIDVRGSTGGLVGSKPMVCSGWAGTTSGYDNKACFLLQEDGQWVEDQALNEPRSYAAYGSMVFNKELLIAGGSDKNIAAKSPNSESRLLPMTLPSKIGHSCIVKWDENTFLLVGGSNWPTKPYERKETYFIHMDNNTVTNGPDLLIPRKQHACNEIIANGESFIIVAGGNDANEKSTEYLSKSNVQNGWQKGKNCLERQPIQSPDLFKIILKRIYLDQDPFQITSGKRI